MPLSPYNFIINSNDFIIDLNDTIDIFATGEYQLLF